MSIYIKVKWSQFHFNSKKNFFVLHLSSISFSLHHLIFFIFLSQIIKLFFFVFKKFLITVLKIKKQKKKSETETDKNILCFSIYIYNYSIFIVVDKLSYVILSVKKISVLDFVLFITLVLNFSGIFLFLFLLFFVKIEIGCIQILANKFRGICHLLQWKLQKNN